MEGWLTGVVRRNHKLAPIRSAVPRHFRFPKVAPWDGDSLGERLHRTQDAKIPNITVYTAVPPSTAARARRAPRVSRNDCCPWIQSLIKGGSTPAARTGRESERDRVLGYLGTGRRREWNLGRGRIHNSRGLYVDRFDSPVDRGPDWGSRTGNLDTCRCFREPADSGGCGSDGAGVSGVLKFRRPSCGELVSASEHSPLDTPPGHPLFPGRPATPSLVVQEPGSGTPARRFRTPCPTTGRSPRD